MKKQPLLIISTILLGLLSGVWLYDAIHTYTTGIVAQSYKHGLAKVGKVSEHFNSLDISRSIVLNYSVDDKPYQIENYLLKGVIVKPGETVDVYYDPSSPQNACMSQEIDYDRVIVKGAFGLFALSFFILILRHLFTASFCKEPSQAEDQAAADS